MAVDKEGNVASITQTLGGAFGSMHVVPGTGIILNNEGEYFDLEPKPRNRVKKKEEITEASRP